MSAELIGILSVGTALLVGLGGLIVTATLWIGGWLRDLDQRMARVEGRMARVEGRMDTLGSVLVQVFAPHDPVAGN